MVDYVFFINCSVYCWFVHIGPCALCTDRTFSLVLSKSRSLATIDATTHNWIWLIFSFICSMYRVCHAHKPTHARIVIRFYLLDLCAISWHLFWIVNFCIIYFHNYRIVYRACFVQCFWHIVIDCAWMGIMLCLYVIFIHSFILYIVYYVYVCWYLYTGMCVCDVFFNFPVSIADHQNRFDCQICTVSVFKHCPFCRFCFAFISDLIVQLFHEFMLHLVHSIGFIQF